MTYPGLHSAQIRNHILENWTYTDSTAREADSSPTTDDLGKVAFQESDSTYWRLTAATPNTWLQCTGTGSIPGATASTQGLIKLAGALSGVADFPTIATGYITTGMLAFDVATQAELDSHTNGIASTDLLGHVKVGSSLAIDGLGVLDVRGLSLGVSKTVTINQTLTINADSDGFTINVPGDGTLAILDLANVYTAAQRVDSDLIVGAIASLGGGSKVVGIQNAVVNPSSTPSGGGVLYASAGGLFWIGSSGTVTPIAPA